MAFHAKPRVLIVDDDIEYLEVVKRYLAEDYIAYTAQGGRAALDFLLQQKVDLILLDVEMPILDGFHTLESIRKMESGIDVPVIFVTGRHDRFTVFHSVQQGVDGYIVKPFEKDALLKKIEEVLHVSDEPVSKETILTVDDDMVFLKMLKLQLQKYYNVIAINSPKLALEYLNKHKPSMILLDYQMPMYNGASLLGMIRKNSATRNIPVVILSGTLDKEALVECLEHQPQKILEKNFSQDELLETIQKILETPLR
ncbi:MAG: response regulator [Lachnospiraceae bacterium]|nr:response regulator [Lachnospiraceae bacterium]